jgi:hypothetical protein
MAGTRGVITIGTFFQRAYERNVGNYELAAAPDASEELTVSKEGATEEVPISKRSARSFEPNDGH